MKLVKRNSIVLGAVIAVAGLTSCGSSGTRCDAYTNNFEAKEKQAIADRVVKTKATAYTPEWAVVELKKDNS